MVQHEARDAVPIVEPDGLGAAGRAVFGIFEGGGAAGITHVGALKAVEANGFAFIGVAGASAGALIAALSAVGYTADEILDTTNNRHLLKSFNLTVEDVLGKADWRRLRWLKKWCTTFIVVLGLIGLLISFAFLAGWGMSITSQLVPHRTVAGLAGILEGVIGILFGLLLVDLSLAMLRRLVISPFFLVSLAPVGLLRRFGLLSSDQLCKIANEILRQKLKEHYRTNGLKPEDVPEVITFADIDPRKVPQCCTLKIVVTNLAGQCLELFDLSRPEVVVAEAVAASACFPLAFRPAAIPSCGTERAEIYADGGLVSNLPTWVFADEKLKYERSHPKGPPVPILAFSLKNITERGPALPQTPRGLFEHIRKIIRSGVFGSQDTIQHFIGDLMVIELTSSLSVFDFDCNMEAAITTFNLGYTDANGPLFAITIAENVLSHFHTNSLNNINNTRVAQSLSPLTQLRVYVVKRFGRSSFQVFMGFNMDDDTDDRLVLDDKYPGAPQAFINKTSIFVNLQQALTVCPMTKYERSLVRKTLQSAITIPVFENPQAWHDPATLRPEPVAALCLDSDDDLSPAFTDVTCLRHILQESFKLSPYLHALYPKR